MPQKCRFPFRGVVLYNDRLRRCIRARIFDAVDMIPGVRRQGFENVSYVKLVETGRISLRFTRRRASVDKRSRRRLAAETLAVHGHVVRRRGLRLPGYTESSDAIDEAQNYYSMIRRTVEVLPMLSQPRSRGSISKHVDRPHIARIARDIRGPLSGRGHE